ncbi:MAG: DNA-binding response regulator, partial [Acidobacteria bacterium]
MGSTTTSPSIDNPIRVALVGSERVTRAGLRLLIDSQPGLRVVCECESDVDVAATWSASRPQIAVIDVDGRGPGDF